MDFNFFYIVVITLVSLIILFVLLKKHKLNVVLFISLFVYHAFFCFVFYYYVLSYGGDALNYHRNASDTSLFFLENPVGTNFITTLTYPLVQIFDMNFFTVSFLFSLFGFFGLLIFYITVKENIGKSKLLALILFIPGLSFWTSSLGKDSLSIFAIALITYGFSKLDKRKSLIIMGLLLLFLLRPHMALLIVFVSGIVVLISSKSISGMSKLFLVIGSFSFLLLAGNFVLQYVGMDSLSTESVESYVEKRESYNAGGSGVDISNYNMVMKMFTYLLRPLFFDASSLMSLVVSVENLFYLILFSVMLRKKFFRYMVKAPLFVKFNFIYGISALIVLSSSTANLGIAVRQKTMFIMNLIIVVLFFIYNRRRTKKIRKIK